MDPEPRREGESSKLAEKAMNWYGWGSPVGLGLFFVLIALFIFLLHARW